MPTASIEIVSISEVVLAISALVAIASLLAVLTERLRIPLPLILVVVGFVAGELARSNGVDLPIEGDRFREVVLFVFLPVLVFEAALLLPARVFGANLIPILTLAIVALAIAAALVGLIVHFELGIALTSALLFGVLISATDPVAVTAVLRKLGLPNRLLVLLEGESLLNDGIAIVLFNILLVAALGTEEISVLKGAADFLYVFLGGAALGAVLGLGVAEIAARLGRLPSTGLTIALAYGAFVLGEEILGFSGVMASVAAGLVLAALSKTLIPREEVETWHTVWETLAFVANGILFVLIGVVIDADLIVDNLFEIAVGIGAVLASRPIAIFAVMPLVTRLAGIPAVGLRNELIVVWGGLRGGVALALALAIPAALPEQETFVAMTAGVVLATLLINATTIERLLDALGVTRPDQLARWVTAAARFDGARVAREELHALHGSADVEARLGEVEQAAAAEIAELGLEEEDLEQALLRRGLSVERATLEELVHEGLVPQWHARVALSSLDDMLDDLSLGHRPKRGLFETRGLGRVVYEVSRRIHMGKLTPRRWVDLAYRDLSARARASADAIDAVDLLGRCPGVTEEAIAEVRGRFERWNQRSLRALDQLREAAPPELFSAAERNYANDLGRLASIRELRDLADQGLASPASVNHAGELIAEHLKRCERERVPIAIDADEDVGG